MFQPHPNLSDEVNAAIAESELAGGVFLDNLAVGRKLLVQTKNTLYTIERREDKLLYISGNEKYCPTPVKCIISGSNFGGSMLKMNFVGRGMFLEFVVDGKTIVTSQIAEVAEIP